MDVRHDWEILLKTYDMDNQKTDMNYCKQIIVHVIFHI
jgi:hypothetical protein